MKLFKLKNILIALSCFGFFLFSGQVHAESSNNETPSIVKQCKDLNKADTDDFTVRFYDLNQDKRALLNGMVSETYGKKQLPYNKVHLDILFKTVESYSNESTRSYLEMMYRAAGN